MQPATSIAGLLLVVAITLTCFAVAVNLNFRCADALVSRGAEFSSRPVGTSNVEEPRWISPGKALAARLMMKRT